MNLQELWNLIPPEHRGTVIFGLLAFADIYIIKNSLTPMINEMAMAEQLHPIRKFAGGFSDALLGTTVLALAPAYIFGTELLKWAYQAPLPVPPVESINWGLQMQNMALGLAANAMINVHHTVSENWPIMLATLAATGIADKFLIQPVFFRQDGPQSIGEAVRNVTLELPLRVVDGARALIFWPVFVTQSAAFMYRSL